MTGHGRFILVDWGSTNRRCYLLSPAEEEIDSVRDDRGVLCLAASDYAGEIAQLRTRFGDHPILLSGMAGSDRGLCIAPYVACPAGLNQLAEAVVASGIDRCFIAPGMKFQGTDTCDVMRGEELQILGAVAAGLMPSTGIACQPGTHCKWVRVDEGRIISVRTAMTGEMFALLRTHSLLNRLLSGAVSGGAAFEQGCRRSIAHRDLLGDLFGARASALLGERPEEAVADYVSGLIIGADVAAHAPDAPVHLLAETPLLELYAKALEIRGCTVRHVDVSAACRAGGAAIWSLMR